MKPILLYSIKDTNGGTLFEFPVDTLLERIIDVWHIIIDYHENYYPFSIDGNDKKYRRLTIEETKTKKFIQLFATMYKKNRINNIRNNSPFSLRINVEGFPMSLKDITRLYISRKSGILFYDIRGFSGDILNDVEKIYFDNQICKSFSDSATLLVLSDVNFD